MIVSKKGNEIPKEKEIINELYILYKKYHYVSRNDDISWERCIAEFTAIPKQYEEGSREQVLATKLAVAFLESIDSCSKREEKKQNAEKSA